MKVKYLIFSMIAVAFLSSAISFDKTLEIGSNAPKIETVDGTNVGYDANSQKKKRLISFWNPKKPSSRISNLKLINDFTKDSYEDIEIISICTDPDDDLLKEVLKIDGIKDVKVYSYSEITPRVFQDYDATEQPRAFLISPQGKILEII